MNDLLDMVLNRGKPEVMVLTDEAWLRRTGVSTKAPCCQNKRPDLDAGLDLMRRMMADGHSLVFIGEHFKADPSTIARRLGRRS